MPGRGSITQILRRKLAKAKSKIASATESEAADELKLTHKKVRSAVRHEIEAVKRGRARKGRGTRKG